MSCVWRTPAGASTTFLLLNKEKQNYRHGMGEQTKLKSNSCCYKFKFDEQTRMRQLSALCDVRHLFCCSFAFSWDWAMPHIGSRFHCFHCIFYSTETDWPTLDHKARPKNRKKKNKIHKAKSDPIIPRRCVAIEVKFATNSVFESLAVRQSTRHRSLCAFIRFTQKDSNCALRCYYFVKW